jgi:dihydrolipoamide dehydrogenase
VSFEGADAKTYDMILVSVGRVPNGKKIGADKAGVQSMSAVHQTDSQMRTNVANIFAIGDIAGNPMLAHKAVHEGTSRPRRRAA